MKIRDKKLDLEISELKKIYKMCKQEIRRIGSQLNKICDPVSLSDLNYQHGFYEGRLKSAADMLNFFQDYNALPLELNYEQEDGEGTTARQYDRLVQLLYHHLASYVFEKSKEKNGGVAHKEDMRGAVLVIQNLTEVLEILDTAHRYFFFDGQDAGWAGVYRKPKKGMEEGKINVVLKLDIG